MLLFPWLGPMKDVIAIAAIAAGVPLLAFRHRIGRARPVDLWLVAATALLIWLYLINVGGRHGVAWAQGVRLVSEPLLLFLAGFGFEQPRRTLRWGIGSLIFTGCAVAVVGLAQQLLGPFRLVSYGYSFDLQVRTISGHLRSFGTLDDPFGYAAFLMLAAAALIFATRRSLLVYGIGALLFLGVLVSTVRTAALTGLALLALEFARRKRVAAAFALACAVGAAAIVVLVNASATQSRIYQGTSATLTLNGRTSAWQTAFGTPQQWFIGQGVGEVGTAASRARYKISQTVQEARKNSAKAVDSGYFATVADVGGIGLVVMMAMFTRVFWLGRARASRGDPAGWTALGFLTVLLIDALTRASFTGFPSAFLGMLLVGIALSAASTKPAREAPEPR